MANLALLVNVLAPIVTSPTGLLHQTIYHPLCLYARHMRGTALDLHVNCDTYTVRPEDTVSARPHRMADQGPFNVLDVAATHDTVARQMTLAVVNRDRDRSIQTEIRIMDGARPSHADVYEFTGADVDAVNSFERPRAVEPRQSPLELGQQSFSYTFSPHSLTLLVMRLR
jgi:alpha-N-arabinofuranosidase